MAKANCEVCGGTGEADSGAPKPDGGWYTYPCECTTHPSPPPDVVEAARRLKEEDYVAVFPTEIADAETVCEWIIQQAAQGKP